ncbi:hypothetical protein K7I13_02600 [Brucepastera parasyntrophica]|uniref:hypothetical protein n=1 Tax=Brucepastera parasyntrophica TaxID=2880008 RepID=UPI00210DE0BF|nr:hypothetical protein [Brucepastera parasyntrophica]ULQ60221.1 hypothetical protein K7I13_02600 [Brucepastera parasyntrophica]
MDKRQLLIRRLEDIGLSLKNSGNALALLALGSCGLDQDRLDEYSDLDFFVIVRNGYKRQYIENLGWLASAAPVGYQFKNTSDGYKLLFTDGVFCEFAVFEEPELAKIPFSEGRLIWHATDFAPSDCVPVTAARQQQEADLQWIIGEALTNLYVGLCRCRRGEKLSACRFIQNYAVDRILDLTEILEKPKKDDKDIFDKTRRIENRYPGLNSNLSGFIQGYDRNPESAKAILEFLDRNFEINPHIKKAITELL